MAVAIEFLMSVFMVPSSAVLAAEKESYGVYETAVTAETAPVEPALAEAETDLFAERALDPYGALEEPREETNRYIIKYREDYQAEVEAELDGTSIDVMEKIHLERPQTAPAERVQGSSSVSVSDVVFKTDVIVLEEAIHPEEVLDNLGDLAEYIEYIQPDLQLSLDSLSGGTSAFSGFTEEGTDTIYSAGASSFGEEAASEPVIVAVLDTGADIDHPALEGHIWTNPLEIPGDGEDNDGNSFVDDVHGWNFPGSSPAVYSSERPLEYAHGTHIMSTIVSAGGDGVVILPVKVFSDGTAYTSDVIAGIQYAVAQGAAVVNCSFGSSEENQALKEAIEAAADVLFVAAVGNHRRDLALTPSYPACFDLPNVISVASVNADDGFSYYSSYGESIIDIAARGRDVVGAFPENESGPLSGTSVAAAQVSGAAAAVKAADTALTAGTLRQRLIDTADRLSNLQNKVWEGRRLNLENALLNAASDDIIETNPADDFDVHGTQMDTDELYELYTGAGDVVQIDAYDHTLVVKEDGTVWAWGYNWDGQCGVGFAQGNVKFAQVQGLSNVVAVSAGLHYSLAARSDGTVWAWGQGYNNIPNQIVGLTDVTAVLARDSSYVLKSNGTVWAWGSNYAGQLGDGSTTTRTTPVQVSGLSGVEELTGGSVHVVARKSNGTVYAWGSNSYGAVGDGTNTNRNVPTQLTSLSGIVKVSSRASHNMAVKNDGTLWSWGQNTYGTLGDDTTINRNSPVQVQGLSNVMDVSAGSNYVLALKTDGTVWVWGQRIAVVGSPADLTLQKTPVQINGIANVMTISTGAYHAIALKTDDTVWAWGDNQYEQLGLGTTACRFVPMPFYGVSNVISVKGGRKDDIMSHNLALKADGTIVAWGDNTYGQLGDNSTTFRMQPVQVQNLSGVTSIAIGYRHNLALKSDGTVWLWGNGYAGQAYSQTYLTPVQVSGLTDVVAISCGLVHNLALKSDGTVWVWGGGLYGALGLGSVTKADTPVQIGGLSNIVAIASGEFYNIVLKSDGTVFAWGYNNHGQLGDGTTIDKSTPFQISSLTDVSAIACGDESSFAVNGTEGTVKGWGCNHNYQFYSSSNSTNVLSPIQVSGLTNIVSVAVGGTSHLLALKADGSILARGYNNDGELGDGTLPLKSNPVSTLLIADATEISAGAHWSYAVMDNTLYAWGRNAYSALGLPYLRNTTTPMQVQLDSAVTGLSLSVTPSTLRLPATGTNTAVVNAIPKDANNQTLEGQTIIYSLVGSYAGISIGANTGLLTISSGATASSVTVKAICGAVSNTLTVAVNSDAHGDGFAEASVISDNCVVEAKVDYAGDNDYFVFTASRSGLYTIRSYGNISGGTGSNIDTYGYLYGANPTSINNYLIYNDDGAGNSNFKITYSLTAGQQYYVRARAYSSTVTGYYTLYVMPDVSADYYIDGALAYDGDSKMYSFTPATSGTYIFTTTGNTDTYGRLLGASLQVLSSNDDGNGGENFRITQSLTAATTYYLEVTSQTDTSGNYRVYVETPLTVTIS
jgi:alpha-tubulin suppressor-like RCC1 family protein